MLKTAASTSKSSPAVKSAKKSFTQWKSPRCFGTTKTDESAAVPAAGACGSSETTLPNQPEPIRCGTGHTHRVFGSRQSLVGDLFTTIPEDAEVQYGKTAEMVTRP